MCEGGVLTVLNAEERVAEKAKVVGCGSFDQEPALRPDKQALAGRTCRGSARGWYPQEPGAFRRGVRQGAPPDRREEKGSQSQSCLQVPHNPVHPFLRRIDGEESRPLGYARTKS